MMGDVPESVRVHGIVVIGVVSDDDVGARDGILMKQTLGTAGLGWMAFGSGPNITDASPFRGLPVKKIVFAEVADAARVHQPGEEGAHGRAQQRVLAEGHLQIIAVEDGFEERLKGLRRLQKLDDAVARLIDPAAVALDDGSRVLKGRDVGGDEEPALQRSDRVQRLQELLHIVEVGELVFIKRMFAGHGVAEEPDIVRRIDAELGESVAVQADKAHALGQRRGLGRLVAGALRQENFVRSGLGGCAPKSRAVLISGKSPGAVGSAR